MDTLGYIITSTGYLSSRYGTPLLYQVRYCTYACRSITINTLINPTRHFKLMNDAIVYAEKYFCHLKLSDPWVYVGNLSDLSAYEYIQWNAKYTTCYTYKTGKYYSIANRNKHSKGRKREQST